MLSRRYVLSPHIHWCSVSGRYILLDLAADRYLQVPAEEFRSLLPYLAPAAPETDVSRNAQIPAELLGITEELAAARIITFTAPPVSPSPPPPLPQATCLFPAAGGTASFFKAFRELPRFLSACATADYHLRRSSLQRIVERVRARKHRIPPEDPGENLVANLTLAYNLLRPLYPRDYLCLFDSLALLEFLSFWRVFPQWVFGVKIDPFQAHCWVQHRTSVLSDTVSFSSRWYTPIMVL